MNSKCDGSTSNSKTLQIQTICSAVSVYLSALDPAMEVENMQGVVWVCMFNVAVYQGTSEITQSTGILLTAYSSHQTDVHFSKPSRTFMWCGDSSTPRYLTVQYSSLSSPVLLNQNWSIHVILIFSVTKQQRHETNPTECWNKGTIKNRHLCSVSYFWCFSPTVPHKQPHLQGYFWFLALSNVKIIFKSINATTWVSRWVLI